MMKHKSIPLCCSMALLLLLLASGKAQSQQGARVELPPGPWTASHTILADPEEQYPVLATALTGDAQRGLEYTVNGLWNRSGKAVKAVKLSWFLSRKGQGGVLRSGETPLIYVSNLAAGRRMAADLPVVRFADLYRPLMKAGRLSGDYVVTVAVSEVEYADGTKWEGEGLLRRSLKR